MKRLVEISLVLLALASISARGQESKGVWSGSVSINAGSNFSEGEEYPESFIRGEHPSNSKGDVEGTLGYKKGRFELKLNLGAGTSYLRTQKQAGSLTITDGDSEFESMSVDMKDAELSQSSYKGRADVIFRPSPLDRIAFFASYNFTLSDAYNSVSGLKLGGDGGMSLYQYTDDGLTNKHTLNPGIEWSHKFGDSGRDLTLKADLSNAFDSRYTLWNKGDGKTDKDDSGQYESGAEVNNAIYRITPDYTDRSISLNAKYRDRNLAGVKGLDTDFAILLRLDQDIDEYSAANLVDNFTRWEDSTRFRESFNYLALTAEGAAHAGYKTGQFELDGTVRLQYFTDRLNSRTDREHIDAGHLFPLVNIKASWLPGSLHRLTLSLNNTIRRPDYLQICWFQRPGAYINELREGNPELNPTRTIRAALEYKFTKGPFSSSFEVGDSYAVDNIEQTYYMQDIEGEETRVYTWVNAGHSHTANAKLSARWSGGNLKAGASANLGYFSGVNLADKVTRNSDWKVEADAAYKWFWDITYLARFRYQSKIIRTYTSITEYFGLDLRISRPFFNNKLELFLEGRDLLDRTIQTSTLSSDWSRLYVVEDNLNRRLVMLGVKYSF